MAEDDPRQIVLLCDGTAEDQIVVTVGVHATEGETAEGFDDVQVPAVERGVSVDLGTAFGSIGDAWIALDGVLQECGLRTEGVYRQILTVEGQVQLAAPVRAVE